MIEIRETTFESGDSKKLLSMFASEWADFDKFDTTRFGVIIPKPIVAIEHSDVVGGVAFTGYKEPGSDNAAVWVNALYVDPTKRKAGLATKLILFSANVHKKLYALTDVPDLYIKAGWNAVKTDAGGTIVKYEQPGP